VRVRALGVWSTPECTTHAAAAAVTDIPMHVDVIIVGAGLSGIGAAAQLSERCPDRRYLVLEARDDLGGTWDLFRYPGIRSDSDMHTMGYSFRPWTRPEAIAAGGDIHDYLRETALAYGVTRHIRFRHRVQGASWSWSERRWTVRAEVEGREVTHTCQYLLVCAGYYRYDHGHRPAFVDEASFEGLVVHPQHWPDDLDTAGMNVVVIGSGATAVTLVPALAEAGAQVTMVQRSPTYVVNRPKVDAVARWMHERLPTRLAHRLTRAKNTRYNELMYRLAQRFPERIKGRILQLAADELDESTVADHFTPSYPPWEQRVCLSPDGDLFAALRDGRAHVVTGTIERFTPAGLRMADGTELPADLIVTATGLDLVFMGDLAIDIDGEPVDFAERIAYKGFAYHDVPNLASIFGYINASWTLRADLVAQVVCRLLNHMAATGTTVCTPRLRPEDADMEVLPFVTGFTPGYMERAKHRFPRQGDRDPWRNIQSYARDKRILGRAPVDDGVMRFT